MPVRIKPTGAMVAGLPTLTPAQFALTAAAKKPGASFAKYRQFINTRRGVVPGQPAWPGRGGAGLPTIESLIRNVKVETPAQIQARANQMTAASIEAQQGLINDEATRARAQALRTMQAQSAAGGAAAAMNKDLFGLVGGEYNAGAKELSGLATGGLADVTDTTAADTASLNEALARVGQGPIDARMAGPQQAAVANYQAGLGATNLATQGQAANFGLAGLINAQNLRATQEAVAGQNVSNTGIEAKQADAIRELARSRPDLAAKYLASLQDANRQQIALGSTLLQQRRAALQAGFEQGVTKTKLAQDIKVTNAQLKAAAAKAADTTVPPSASLSRAMGYLVDANGNPILNKKGTPIMLPGFKVGKDGKVVKTGAAARGKPASTPQVQSFLKSLIAKSTGSTSVTTRNKKTGKSTTTRSPVAPANKFTMGFTPAYKRLLAMGLDDATARHYLDSVYKRGEGGRDWLRNEEQAVLQQAYAATKNKGYGQGEVRPKSQVIMGIHYLDHAQVSALTQANRLPPGHWMNGTTKTKDYGPVYVIDQTYD